MSRFLGKIKLFDVSLRDGLQGLNPLKIKFYHKKNMYNDIVKKYNPQSMEIGSFVSPKILPIFSDTKDLLEYAVGENPIKHHYVLVPNNNYLFKAIASGATNFSFITSVSDSFQMKNTNMSLYNNTVELNRMMATLAITGNPFRTRIYVSCINECPIEGKIPNKRVVGEIFALNSLGFNKICLSDTCGSLSVDDFTEIMEELEKVGMNAKSLSMHLHVKPKRTLEVERVVHKALDYDIDEFDVSVLESGGCSVTMNQAILAPNLSYELMNEFLENYEKTI